MVNILDFALFRLLNDYSRFPVLDLIMPVFAHPYFVLAFALILLASFTIICRKVYGEAMWRTIALSFLLLVSVGIAFTGSNFWKNTFERSRPYETLPQIIFYDGQKDAWIKTELLQNASQKPETALSASENTQTTEAEKISIESANELLAEKVKQVTNEQYNLEIISPTHLEELHNKSGFSMPSALAAISMAITLIISLLIAKTSPWIYIVPILIGWARIYTGYSYPLDIVVGWIWSVFAVAIAWFICDFILKRFSKTHKL